MILTTFTFAANEAGPSSSVTGAYVARLNMYDVRDDGTKTRVVYQYHHGLNISPAEILDAEDVGESEEEEEADEVEEEEEAEAEGDDEEDEVQDNVNPPSGIVSAQVLKSMFACKFIDVCSDRSSLGEGEGGNSAAVLELYQGYGGEIQQGGSIDQTCLP